MSIAKMENHIWNYFEWNWNPRLHLYAATQYEKNGKKPQS